MRREPAIGKNSHRKEKHIEKKYRCKIGRKVYESVDAENGEDVETES